jgi:hypothetical protein
MDRPSNYPRATKNGRFKSELGRVYLWLGFAFCLNFFLSLPFGAWYFFTNYMIGEIEMSPAELYRMGGISAVGNVLLVGFPTFLYYWLVPRPRAQIGLVAILSVVASLPCLAVIPIFWLMRSVKREQDFVEDIQTTLAESSTMMKKADE